MASWANSVFDNGTTILLTLVVCLIFCFYFYVMQMTKGPKGLPYLGYYPFLSGNFHLELDNLTKKYGEAYCFSVTGQTYVHLGSVKAIREAHITKLQCFERPRKFSFIFDTFGNGVGFVSGDKWKVLRKFFVQLLKEYGMGKNTLENLVGECIQETVNTLRNNEKEVFDALAVFTVGSTEVIRGLLFSGAKIDPDDVVQLIEGYKVMMKCMEGKKQLIAGPLLKYVLLNLIPEFRRYRQHKFKMESTFAKIIREHEKAFDKNNLGDLIDCYINERKLLEEKGDPKAKMFSEKALVSSLVQFFGDGGLSIGFLIASVLKDLSRRAEVQKEIQRELDEVVGHNRIPSCDDKNRMPYTNAAICETLRICSLIPAFPSLECINETTVCDCRVPKGAITVVNFWAALHDPDIFEEPEKYDPTRFLPSEDKKHRCELPIIFGVGKRSCIGEPLVSMETFLFVSTILQNFDITPASEEEKAESVGKQEDGIQFNIPLRATSRAS